MLGMRWCGRGGWDEGAALWKKRTPPSRCWGAFRYLFNRPVQVLFSLFAGVVGSAGEYGRPATDTAVVVGRVVDGAHAVDMLRAGIKSAVGEGCYGVRHILHCAGAAVPTPRLGGRVPYRDLVVVDGGAAV